MEMGRSGNDQKCQEDVAMDFVNRAEGFCDSLVLFQHKVVLLFLITWFKVGVLIICDEFCVKFEKKKTSIVKRMIIGLCQMKIA
ncbi:hypothetical protein EGH10_13930 [Brevibacillus laterosporus]|nr:hypothetical protein DM460_10490 [Brevibacillus laterosporus]TPH09377.1 hypothetical protein EGH10_13930 [Brevibacillus laterosporus]